MRKITLLIASIVFTTSFCFGQNLVQNSDFEAGSPGDDVPSWGGYKNRIANDDIRTQTKVGQIENGDGSLFQEVSVTPGETYDVSLDYRWVNTAAANSNLVIRVKEVGNLSNNLALNNANLADGYTLDTEIDIWKSASFSVTIPSGITGIRLLLFKSNGNKPLNIDNASITPQTLSVTGLKQFEFESYPNPFIDMLNIQAASDIDKIEVFNLMGKRVISETINAKQTQLETSNLSSGVYILKAYINASVGTYKLLKK